MAIPAAWPRALGLRCAELTDGPAYIDAADWLLVGEQYPVPTGTEDDGEESKKPARRTTRVYECGRDAWRLLDAGKAPDAHSTGWMYDKKRRLA